MVLGGLVSCNFFQKENDENERGAKLARVYDEYLYENDVAEILPPGLGENDSLAFLQNYITTWAKDQLMIYKAQYNISDSDPEFERKIQDYRNDLLKFKYRQEFLRKNLDTSFSKKEIQAYYESGAQDFALKENILTADYAIINKEAPELETAIRQFRGGGQENLAQFEEFALSYAYKFSLGDSAWMNATELQNVLPKELGNPQSFFTVGRFVRQQDSINVYLLAVRDVKKIGDEAPLRHARPVIQNILLNRKKLQLLERLEQNLLDDALKKKGFETY